MTGILHEILFLFLYWNFFPTYPEKSQRGRKGALRGHVMPGITLLQGIFRRRLSKNPGTYQSHSGHMMKTP
jgi:hypothetical protein